MENRIKLLTEDGCMTVNLFGRASSYDRSVAKIREASKVEILDEDLKKYAEEASKAAKTYQENKQKALDQGGLAPAIGGDDATTGKGDLQLPAQ